MKLLNASPRVYESVEKKLYKPKEKEISKAFLELCELKKIVVIHIPNEGVRNYKHDGAKGIRKGFPDYFIPIVKIPYGGLFLELKAHNKSAISDEQWLWIERLNQFGYLASIVIGFDEAKYAVENYISIPFGTAKWDVYLSKLRRSQ